MDDIFYTECTDKENEKKIFNIEEQNNIEKIKNNAFNKGYLSKASEFHEDEYNKGFSMGENYSLEYGKLLGIIEAPKPNQFNANSFNPIGYTVVSLLKGVKLLDLFKAIYKANLD